MTLRRLEVDEDVTPYGRLGKRQYVEAARDVLENWRSFRVQWEEERELDDGVPFDQVAPGGVDSLSHEESPQVLGGGPMILDDA